MPPQTRPSEEFLLRFAQATNIFFHMGMVDREEVRDVLRDKYGWPLKTREELADEPPVVVAPPPIPPVHTTEDGYQFTYLPGLESWALLVENPWGQEPPLMEEPLSSEGPQEGATPQEAEPAAVGADDQEATE